LLLTDKNAKKTKKKFQRKLVEKKLPPQKQNFEKRLPIIVDIASPELDSKN
jgi:hypothetical protein